jgi:hypothetical protein
MSDGEQLRTPSNEDGKAGATAQGTAAEEQVVPTPEGEGMITATGAEIAVTAVSTPEEMELTSGPAEEHIDIDSMEKITTKEARSQEEKEQADPEVLKEQEGVIPPEIDDMSEGATTGHQQTLVDQGSSPGKPSRASPSSPPRASPSMTGSSTETSDEADDNRRSTSPEILHLRTGDQAAPEKGASEDPEITFKIQGQRAASSEDEDPSMEGICPCNFQAEDEPEAVGEISEGDTSEDTTEATPQLVSSGIPEMDNIIHQWMDRSEGTPKLSETEALQKVSAAEWALVVERSKSRGPRSLPDMGANAPVTLAHQKRATTRGAESLPSTPIKRGILTPLEIASDQYQRATRLESLKVPERPNQEPLYDLIVSEQPLIYASDLTQAPGLVSPEGNPLFKLVRPEWARDYGTVNFLVDRITREYYQILEGLMLELFEEPALAVVRTVSVSGQPTMQQMWDPEPGATGATGVTGELPSRSSSMDVEEGSGEDPPSSTEGTYQLQPEESETSTYQGSTVSDVTTLQGEEPMDLEDTLKQEEEVTIRSLQSPPPITRETYADSPPKKKESSPAVYYAYGIKRSDGTPPATPKGGRYTPRAPGLQAL